MATKTELLLIRHGETDYNKNSIIQGQTDTELNESGIIKAEETAEFLKNYEFDHIYSSDLKRAKKTASFIADKLELEIKESKKIREIDFGDWEGLKLEEIVDQYPDDMEAWRIDPLNNGAPGGENITQFAARIKSFFDQLLEKHRGEKLIVVTHGGVIKLYLREVLAVQSKSFKQFQVDNTSLTEIKFYDDDAILSKLNYVVGENFK
ncbi:alpha-ribazole phosphatase [Halanaerobium hydrogeniformans]|uniref:Alpha-ribazole phosphatase n=1 Tax=Halanaerobium hydrogeniformans TaxID=656519 RepID=E4RNR4_HALHG|nr:alpha-ribazole phosphatase [Halanaerobium hydrogeniformans]ADQ13742.1 Phosphoglycerate mutase [Halanaerobium hydrogeniformans]